MISQFHEMMACKAANYRYFHDWQELTPQQKELLSAHYLAGILLDSHKDDAVNRAMEKQRKRSSKKGKK